jgi:ArsR family transcriptional regulator
MLTKEELSQVREQVAQGDERLPFMFNALSDSSRFRIFKLLASREDLCVSEIAHVFDISVPAASQQLKLMEMSGMVRRQRHGQMICYCVKQDDPTVKALLKIVLDKGRS